MIGSDVKKKLILELEKDGNILNSCRKVGIAPATYYRWKGSDGGFRKRVTKAIRIGRINMTDMAEHAMMILIKEKYFPAIKWMLQQNSKRYKPKQRKVLIEYSKLGQSQVEFEQEKREHYDNLTEELRRAHELITKADLVDDNGET